MKNFCFVLALLFTGSIFYSCIKETVPKPKGNSSGNNTKTTGTTGGDTTQTIVPINQKLLVGTWQVINDTTTDTPWGLWASHPVTGQNYIGKPVDYYQFTADGHMYDYIRGHADTATYTVSKNQVDIEYTYTYNTEQPAGLYHGLWTFVNLTASTTSFNTLLVSPEVAYYSVTNLRK